MKDIKIISQEKYADQTMYEKAEDDVYKIVSGDHAGWFAMTLFFTWSKGDREFEDHDKRTLYNLNEHVVYILDYKCKSVILDSRIDAATGLLEVAVSNEKGISAWKDLCGKFVYLEYVPADSAPDPIFELNVKDKADYSLEN